VDNARKFSPPSTPIHIQLIETLGNLELSVIDQGPGIPEELRERVFEKFARMERSSAHHSFGLGLTFCKLAVEAHGGSIGVDAVPEGGSRFYFSLPTSSAGTVL
jgi:signal transduction histidine kinase